MMCSLSQLGWEALEVVKGFSFCRSLGVQPVLETSLGMRGLSKTSSLIASKCRGWSWKGQI